MSYVFTPDQKSILITTALAVFAAQRGINLDPNGFDLYVDKPNEYSLCSIVIYSLRTDDRFKMKLYVRSFEPAIVIEPFKLLQEQNFATGNNDEIFVSNTKLPRELFSTFYRYLVSDNFREDVIDATDFIVLEGEEGSLLLEDDGHLLLEY